MAVAYHCKNSDGDITQYSHRVPANLKLLEPDSLEIRYEELDGWMEYISEVRDWSQLPNNAKAFVEYVEQEVEVKIRWVGVGAGRDALIRRD